MKRKKYTKSGAQEGVCFDGGLGKKVSISCISEEPSGKGRVGLGKGVRTDRKEERTVAGHHRKGISSELSQCTGEPRRLKEKRTFSGWVAPWRVKRGKPTEKRKKKIGRKDAMMNRGWSSSEEAR